MMKWEIYQPTDANGDKTVLPKMHDRLTRVEYPKEMSLPIPLMPQE
jgi:hypothetical protein